MVRRCTSGALRRAVQPRVGFELRWIHSMNPNHEEQYPSFLAHFSHRVRNANETQVCERSLGGRFKRLESPKGDVGWKEDYSHAQTPPSSFPKLRRSPCRFPCWRTFGHHSRRLTDRMNLPELRLLASLLATLAPAIPQAASNHGRSIIPEHLGQA